MDGGVDIRVLGPLEVTVGGVPVELPGAKPRVLLAVLALSAGRPVPVAGLAGRIWEDAPPEHLRGSLQTYVMRLRRVLGAGAIETVPGGYRLSVDPDRVDLPRFRRLVADAARLPEPAAERAALAEALSLWRGEPLAGLPSEELARRDVPRLVEERLAVLERRADLDLALGRHAELVAELRELTGRHPLRESLWSRLVTALHRAGRTAEAIEAYHRLRATLADELGIDPSPELQRRYRELLAGTPAAAPAPAPVVPRQLPPDVSHFTGRHAEEARLGALLRDHPADPDAPPLLVALDGAAGVGKTALAVRWAHRARDRFPDGALHLDLRGYGPAEPVTPASALDTLLRALGTPPGQVPPDTDGRAAALRSRLAGRRMVLLLDDARDAGQVRPLLPGAGCLVLVTSRDQLRGLISRDGAHRVTLHRLPPGEAVALLAAAVGADRAAAEPRAVAELAELCARLPLALRVAGEHAGRHEDRPLAELVADLRGAQDRLDALADGQDRSTDLRAVFSWSYRALEPAAGRAFRLLGLHPAAEVDLPAAAALLGAAVPAARRLLDRLVAVHLLEQPGPDRYRFHDLLRAYAAAVAERDEPPAGRDGAVRRMLDWYAHTAAAATGHEWRATRRAPPPEPPPAGPGVTPLAFADQDAATGWLEAHRGALPAVASAALAHGARRHAWCLAELVGWFLARRGYLHDLAELAGTGQRAAHGADAAAESAALRLLGIAHAGLRDPDGAIEYHLRALALDTDRDDRSGQAANLTNLAMICQDRRRFDDSLRYYRRGLAAVRGTDLVAARANILNGMANIQLSLGRPADAVATCEEALAEYLTGPDPLMTAALLDTLASARLALGRRAEALDAYQQAWKSVQGLGLHHFEGMILLNLGRATRDSDPAAARGHWRHALEVLAGTGDPLADEILAELSR